jgi:putative transposase
LVTRSFRYRLVPTRSQAATLTAWLATTRELYNAALQERRDAWRKQGVNVNYYSQQAQITDIRAIRGDVAAVPVVVLRGALRRIDRAFAAFFRRVKSGETPGYPRFRGRVRWTSLLIDDLGGRVPIIAGGKRVAIPLLGKVKFKQHRPLLGTPKAMRLTLDAGGRWFVTFACVDVPVRPAAPATNEDVGVDLGLLSFAATSDGELFDNPRVLRAARVDIERAQRRPSCTGCTAKRKKLAGRSWKWTPAAAVKRAAVAVRSRPRICRCGLTSVPTATWSSTAMSTLRATSSGLAEAGGELRRP